jgi:hypothetical protein
MAAAAAVARLLSAVQRGHSQVPAAEMAALAQETFRLLSADQAAALVDMLEQVGRVLITLVQLEILALAALVVRVTHLVIRVEAAVVALAY